MVLALVVGFGAGYGVRNSRREEAPPPAPAAERAPAPERTELSRVAEREAEVQGQRLVMHTEEPWRAPPAPPDMVARDLFVPPVSCPQRVVKLVKVSNDWEGHATRPVLTNVASVPLRDIRARIDINGKEKVWVFPTILPGQTVKGEGRLPAAARGGSYVISFSVRQGSEVFEPLGRGKTVDACAEGPGPAGYFQLSRD